MRTFKKSNITQDHFHALQYGVDEKANEFVSLCKKNHKNEIKEVPGDLMRTPQDAFDAVETSDSWTVINKKDWIVKSGEQVFVIPNGIFKLFFEEVK